MIYLISDIKTFMILFFKSMRYYSFNCSATANDKEVYLEFAWDIVKGKIMDSLCFIQNEVNVGDRVAELEEGHMKKPSSLHAVTEGPRMRLLWASFQWLKDEAGTVFLVSLKFMFITLCIVREWKAFFFSYNFY